MYVFQIPFGQLKLLSSILDVAGEWEKLAGRMGFTSEEVCAFRQAPSRGESSTAEILRAWGSRGYKVDQLFELLMATQQQRAMQVLLPFVDKKYQAIWEKRKAKLAQPTTDSSLDTDQSSMSPLVAASALDKNGLPITAGVVNQPTPRSSQQENASALDRSRQQQAQSSMASSSGFDFAIAAGLHSTISIPYPELAEATDQFAASNVLGRGGYGVVFRGSWKHTLIAIKVIGGRHHRKPAASNNSNAEKERLKQSLMELKTLALYRHDNILPLYAYSLDGPEPCLVYQFMAGGSLEDRLLCRNGTAPLNWKQRHAIATGASRGLNFLHTCAREPLIHGDIKSANILLDSHLEAKIGDFGLSRRGIVEIPGNTPPMIVSHIKGTLAYLPPEFLRCKHLSTKLDVFSFGVVLFEIATGLRAYSDSRKPENLVEFIRSQINDEILNTTESCARFADCKADGEGVEEVVSACIKTGLRCAALDPAIRPSMKEVLEVLVLSSN